MTPTNVTPTFCCGRCRAGLTIPAEVCWWCTHPLCHACWETHGHCGHSKAEEQNEAGRQAKRRLGLT